VIRLQKGGVKFSVVTGSGKVARIASVLVSILRDTFSDDGARCPWRERLSFTDYSILTSSKGSTQPALNSSEKATTSVFRAGERKTVNARDQAPALSVSLERGSYQRVARRMNGAGVYQLGDPSGFRPGSPNCLAVN